MIDDDFQLEPLGFAHLLPEQPTTDEAKIDALLDALSSGFEGDPDLDLVRDSALVCLLQFQSLPERTIDVMLAILALDDDSDLVLTRKMAACDVLGRMDEGSKFAVAKLNDLLPLVESDRDFERWLALRAAKAIWQISGDSAPAVEVAGILAEDEEAWLVIHATILLCDIPQHR